MLQYRGNYQIIDAQMKDKYRRPELAPDKIMIHNNTRADSSIPRRKSAPRALRSSLQSREATHGSRSASPGAGTEMGSHAPLPKKNFVPLGVEYLFEQTWSCLESAAGPQKNCGQNAYQTRWLVAREGERWARTTPTSVSVCFSAIELKTLSQFGRP